jgi:peroxiredoxin
MFHFSKQINLNKFSFRYALVVDDNKVKKVLVEPDGTGLSCSLSQNLLDVIKKKDLAK